MFRRAIACIAVPAFLALGCADGTDSQSAAPAMPAEPAAPSASEVLDDVVAAMGTANLSSVTYSGRAWRIRNGWMQTPHADPPWPYRDEITNYRRTIDLGQPASSTPT